MKRYIIAALFAASFSTFAAQECYTVPGRSGGTRTVCKNVPDAPAEPVPVPVPEPANKPAPATARPVQVVTQKTVVVAAVVPFLTPSAQGKTTVNFGAVHVNGSQSIGISFANRVTRSMVLSGGIAHSSGQTVAQIAAGFEF